MWSVKILPKPRAVFSAGFGFLREEAARRMAIFMVHFLPVHVGFLIPLYSHFLHSFALFSTVGCVGNLDERMVFNFSINRKMIVLSQDI